MDRKTSFELPNAQKTALLLIALGKDAASEILRCLSDDEIHRISYWIRRMPIASSEMLSTIVNEFFVRLKGANHDVYEGGQDYLYELLSKSHGTEKAKAVLYEIENSTTHQNDIKSHLSASDPKHLAEMLMKETSETIALLFCLLEESRTAHIFANIPFKKQIAILLTFAEFDQMDPGSLTFLLQQSEYVFEMDSQELASTPNVAKIASAILRHIDKPLREQILKELEQKKPEFTTKIQNYLFVYEDLEPLRDDEIKEVIENISPIDVALAVYDSEAEVKSKWLQYFSKELMDKIRTQIILQEPITPYIIRAAQKDVFYYLHLHKGNSV